jgi:hypothetical protein
MEEGTHRASTEEVAWLVKVTAPQIEMVVLEAIESRLGTTMTPQAEVA